MTLTPASHLEKGGGLAAHERPETAHEATGAKLPVDEAQVGDHLTSCDDSAHDHSPFYLRSRSVIDGASRYDGHLLCKGLADLSFVARPRRVGGRTRQRGDSTRVQEASACAQVGGTAPTPVIPSDRPWTGGRNPRSFVRRSARGCFPVDAGGRVAKWGVVSSQGDGSDPQGLGGQASGPPTNVWHTPLRV